MRSPILAQGTPRSRGATIRVLVVPDAFKGTLASAAAAAAIARGVQTARPGTRTDVLPLADGGDGTLAALAAAGFVQRPVVTRGPTGVPVAAAIARRGTTSVVELAACCGLALLPSGVSAPMTSSTLGLGDAVTAALADVPRELVVCLGGSASTDGGCGLLVGLGARLLDAGGGLVAPGGAGLARVARIDLNGLDRRLTGPDAPRVVVATDVRSPLLGPDGAAAAFGPQKGATPAQVRELEHALASWARVLAATTGVDAADRPGAGAAGGAGLAAMAALGAEPVSGAGFVHAALGLPERIAAADLVITGEGRLDRTSLLGKGVGEVARLAQAAGVEVLAVCGQVELPAATAAAAGITRTVDLRAAHGERAWHEPAAALADAVARALGAA